MPLIVKVTSPFSSLEHEPVKLEVFGAIFHLSVNAVPERLEPLHIGYRLSPSDAINRPKVLPGAAYDMLGQGLTRQTVTGVSTNGHPKVVSQKLFGKNGFIVVAGPIVPLKYNGKSQQKPQHSHD